MMSSEAIALWNGQLSQDDRVLILGATGWFGKTALWMSDLPPERMLLLASADGSLESRGRAFPVYAFDQSMVERFEPTVVLDFWFLTREKILSLGVEKFRETNLRLIEATSTAISLDSVNRVISTSSGAAVHASKNSESSGSLSLYGEMKLYSETVVKEASQASGANLTLARVYSVSGALVTRPHDYAFSNLAMQALSGEIRIEASHPVRRRYVSVEDLLAASLASSRWGTTEFSSGGDLVELSELASILADSVDVECTIRRQPMEKGAESDDYFSMNEEWQYLVSRVGLKPLSVLDQAQHVLTAFRRGFP